MGEEFALSNIRVKFIRGEEVKYISHLDLMKAFERALRRANLPIAYSQGFNPHPQMVFGLPLSVGVTSEAEYADFELSVDVEPEKFAKILNENLPAGLKIEEANYLHGKSNIMKEISTASYDVLVFRAEDEEMVGIEGKIKELLAQDQVNVVKEGKKGAREIDIKPMVHGLKMKTFKPDELETINYGNTSIIPDRAGAWVKEYAEALVSGKIRVSSYKYDSFFLLSLLLSAGSVANLKPELFIQALKDKYGLNLKVVKVHRIGLYVNDGEFSNPLGEPALS